MREPEFVCAVMAATVGSRLFPLTGTEGALPKHLLPVGGVPLLERLILSLHAAGLTEVIVFISQNDTATPALIERLQQHREMSEKTKIRTQEVANDCTGSAQALQGLPDSINKSSHLLVLPGDLLVMDPAVITDLIRRHRLGTTQPAPSALTMLITNVCQIDPATNKPLKESKKAKLGFLTRDEKDIEYMATTKSGQVLFKLSKLDVETDEELLGKTPKLNLSKSRLTHFVREPITIQTDYNDVHSYVLSPWIWRDLIPSRDQQLVSVKDDLLPLLISRQFKGVKPTFGSKLPPEYKTDVHRYAVRAHVLQNPSAALRACTVPSYSFACKEFITKATSTTHPTPSTDARSPFSFPEGSTLNKKFNYVVLPNSTLAEKVTIKTSTIGTNVKIGTRSRLNNVVVMDNAEIGDNCVIQNSILSARTVIGENSNLNECHLAPTRTLPPMTKERGETFA